MTAKGGGLVVDGVDQDGAHRDLAGGAVDAPQGVEQEAAAQAAALLGSVHREAGEACSVGLAGGDLGEAIEQATTKDALKQATTRAWERGVVGVPCIRVGEKILYGDDQLEFAADMLSAASGQ